MTLMKLVHCLQPETAHNLGLWALRNHLVPAPSRAPTPSLEVSALGLRFPNPVGLAAGFDKNAVATTALLKQGFGFVEAGTVTPLPQEGNPKPRIFRLVEDRAVINRLGFNNEGLAPYVERMSARDKRAGIVGANIGKNKDAADAVADYVTGLKAVYPYADYITINISSPNTPGLRALQHREALDPLLSALTLTRHDLTEDTGLHVPLLLKIAPDMSAEEMQAVAESVLAHGINGVIISNTTLSRPSLSSVYHAQQGGLSGAPLFTLSTEKLKAFYRLTEGKIPLIGAGGIASADDAYMKIRAGATLVQLYSALVYQGFGLVRKINAGLAARLQADGFSHIRDAIGVDAK